MVQTNGAIFYSEAKWLQSSALNFIVMLHGFNMNYVCGNVTLPCEFTKFQFKNVL